MRWADTYGDGYTLAHSVILSRGNHFHLLPELNNSEGSFDDVTPIC